MRRVGIVGNGSDKFTNKGEAGAKDLIDDLVMHADVVVSGHSPLGGVDIWAEEAGKEMQRELDIKEPKDHSWNGAYGYRKRNLDIARDSDEVHVIVAEEYPPGYTGRRFRFCYHCIGSEQPIGDLPHVKSGGCWTGHKARIMGKEVTWHIISN